jgi:hypothetical protein
MECRVSIDKKESKLTLVATKLSLVIETTNGLIVKLPLSTKEPAEEIARKFKGQFGWSEICQKINNMLAAPYIVQHIDDNFIFSCEDIKSSDHWEAVISAEVVGECLMSDFVGRYV